MSRLIDADALKIELANKSDVMSVKLMSIIDNAPTVKDRYGEGYAQGYIDGSTGADMRGDNDPLEEDAKQSSIPYSYQMPKDYIKNKLDYWRGDV